MTAPINITRLLRQNAQYADADAYARSVTLGSTTAAWHERAFAAAPQQHHASSSSTDGSGRSTALLADAQAEAEASAARVLELRRAALTNLLETERLAYARELAAKGLALRPADD